MKKFLVVAVLCAGALISPARAEEMSTTTPPLALPEPETPTVALPHSEAVEAQPLALPEPETEAIAPYHRCGDRDTVYLTN